MKVIVYTDGGSRGNPGVAGSGSVVYAQDNITVLREIAYVVGQGSTNNVAEYHGLLRGLEAAQELGATEVEVFTDSKLVVEQISGRWKIKHPDMQQLAVQAHALIRQFAHFDITWVPRAKNKVADALSNVAMDACAAGHPQGIVTTSDAAAAAFDMAPAPQDTSAREGTSAEPAHDEQAVTMIVLCHGETEYAGSGKFAGRADIALSEEGKYQARRAAAALAGCGAHAIITSPLQRCRDTAALLGHALGVEVEENEQLAELDYGLFEGLDAAQARERDPEFFDQWLEDTGLSAPGGESLQALHRRVRAARTDLAQRFAGRTIVVVSHVNPIKSLVRQALDAGPVTLGRVEVSAGSVSRMEFWPQGSKLTGLNDVAHLR